MNIDEIKDVAYSIKQDSSSNQEVNFNFVYNLYEENETLCNDKTFSLSFGRKKKRFIRITVENAINRSNDIVGTENLLQFLRDMSGKDLYENDREVFNRLDMLTSKRKNLTVDTKEKEVIRFFKTYKSSANHDLDEESINKLERSRNISILSDKNFENNLIRKEFPETFNYNNFSNYESVVYNETVKKTRSKNITADKFRSGELFPDLKIASKSINLGDVTNYSKLNCLDCGRYVEKFVKSENDTYEFLCSRFFIQDSMQNSFDIEDEAVRYGKEYRYVIYNVMLFTSVDVEDRFVRNHYLLCTHPYISNDISCTEKERPPAPIMLKAEMDVLRKSLYLSWQEPTNYQGDIRGYQIFKRESIYNPFELVVQLEGHKNDDYNLSENVQQNLIEKTPGVVKTDFYDSSFNTEKFSIYTIRSIDAHGMLSDYSEQIAVFYDELRNHLVTKLVSHSGANVLYPNEKLVRNSIFYENTFDIVDNLPIKYKPKKIRLYVTPDYAQIEVGQKIEKTLSGEYQFTMTDINNRAYRSDKFTINNFG